MNNLKNAINGKSQWSSLLLYVNLVEQNRENEPNIALDGAKSIIESISKTILTNKGINFNIDSKLGFLVRKAFESLPVFDAIKNSDSESAKRILGALSSITIGIGEFRNNHGFFSHGRDLQAQKFDRYLVELSISSVDLLGSFLIRAHAEDFKNRSRVFYEDHIDFNTYLDNNEDEWPTVQSIPLQPSSALFHGDREAYKEQLNAFISEKDDLISKMEHSENFVITRSVASSLLAFKEYFTENEIHRLVYACTNNSQIHHILGHGYTKILFEFIRDEKIDCLNPEMAGDFRLSFNKAIY